MKTVLIPATELLWGSHTHVTPATHWVIWITRKPSHRLYPKHHVLKWLIHLFSCSVASHFLWPHGLHHARPPCPSPSPGVCSNSCPSSRQCHPTILSSVVPFSSWLLSFPESGSFPISWLLASGGQSIGASASESILPMNIQSWFPLGLTGLISLQFKGFSKSLIQRHQFFGAQPFYCPALTSIHDYWKNHSFNQIYICCQSDVSAF